MRETLTAAMVRYASQLSADLVGIADLDRVKGIETRPAGLLAPFTRAIVIAAQLPLDTFAQIREEPTHLYAQQYVAANKLLDRANLLLRRRLIHRGYRALAIPAAHTVDRHERLGHVSTKAIARAAGLGWLGKNLLLVTPQYGSRVRIACLLTDAPLVPDPVMANRCGTCTRCKEACPVGAIRGASWQDYPSSREVAIDLHKCVERLVQNAAKPGIGGNICGVCIRACRWGQEGKPTQNQAHSS